MPRSIANGLPEPLGVTPVEGGVNVAVFSAHATSIEFCLFDACGGVEVERLALGGRSGDIFHAHVADVAAGARYGLRAHGPYAPGQGHRFNPAKLLVDPHALALDRCFALHASQLAYTSGDPHSSERCETTDSAASVPKAIVTDPRSLAGKPTHVRVPWSETIVQELHVRGFTKLHPDIPEPIRGTFAALAEPAAIGHLRNLGITTVELMPAAAWIDERHLPALGLTDYWGYNPIAMLAPDPRLAPGGWAEVRRAVDALHAAGIEVILDVVLNHSGESDEFGATLSLRGLDNASYYRLLAEAPQRYVNDTGCGNCLALDRAPVVRLALAALHAWVEYAGVDGFRFDLGTTLGRRDGGFDAHAPLLAAIADDLSLRDAKLIVEPWDVGPGGYQLGRFPARCGEWNDRFRDDVRRYWRGDAGLRGAIATRLAGSSDVLATKGSPSRGINFVTAHDGFTLADLVSYAGRHNEANGEGNRDGTNENFSWNHGIEGHSDGEAIRAARARDQRNLLATLLLARGTPMLSMGAESGATQHGNNNAYAQDNATSWLDWRGADRGLLAFVQRLVALRRAHPALRADRFLEGAAIDESGIADVEWRSPNDAILDAEGWQRSADDALAAIFYAPADAGRDADRVAVITHRADHVTQMALPEPRDGFVWSCVLDTAGPTDAPRDVPDSHVSVPARSVVVVIERRQADAPMKLAPRRVDEGTLARLADAAGISRDWWDVAGNRHVVCADTQRALLAAMDLDCATTSQARESLNRIARIRERRTLPFSFSTKVGEAARLTIAADANGALPRDALVLQDERGAVVTTIVPPVACDAERRDVLGLRLRTASLSLPQLEVGRYSARFESAPEVACRISIAPHSCHLPDFIANGQRRFGISAQLYSLRRAGDGGIGDFTTLAETAAAAARRGATTFGINPLHMLFPRDRERASPYHPSDRRFLDPLYLDLDALGDIPGLAEVVPPRIDAGTLSRTDAIDYHAVWSAKAAFLRSLFAAFERVAQAQPDAAPIRAFDDFIAASGRDLARFATFDAIASLHPERAWSAWPDALRDAQGVGVARFAQAHDGALRHAMFLQWLADRQLAAAAARARGAGLELGFYRDLAIGCAPDGAEAWSNAALFAQGVSIGAPPDPLGPDGQVWNLPPPNPLAQYQTGFAAFRAVVAANMRHAGALRIDHAMGLSRLFWIPAGGRAADGAYVDYAQPALLGEIAVESARARCLVVGEDLGTVPDGLRETLASAGLLSYRVLLLERSTVGFVRPRTYPAQAVACAATHDLPPLAGWWDAADIRERHALGLIGEPTLQERLDARRDEKLALLQALSADGVPVVQHAEEPLGDDLMAALHGWLAQAPSALMLIQAEDLAGETTAQNLPGTDRERPNWRRRLPASLEELLASERARKTVATVGALRGSRRS